MFIFLPVYLTKGFQKCARAVNTSPPVSTSGLCRSQNVDTGCVWGREEDPKHLPMVSSAVSCLSPSWGY